MRPAKHVFLPSLPLTSVVRENTRAMVAQSRQLLQETEAVARGYTPTKDRYLLLRLLADARQQAESGAARVDQKRRRIRKLVAQGIDASQAKDGSGSV